ncbi:hypothetical protein VTK56DRAFT_29 [Thermocarpiscus australiensis]
MLRPSSRSPHSYTFRILLWVRSRSTIRASAEPARENACQTLTLVQGAIYPANHCKCVTSGWRCLLKTRDSYRKCPPTVLLVDSARKPDNILPSIPSISILTNTI